MAVLVVLLMAIVVVLVVRSATSAQGGAVRGPRLPRARRTHPPVAPDDDPEFLRELQRRLRRDDTAG